MVKKEWAWMYFNDEWNEPTTNDDDGDDDNIDGVDEYFSPSDYKKNTWEYEDDYEEYGH